MNFEIESATRFTVGTVGEPGRRVFLIQIEGDGRSITLKTEKESVRTWAEYFGGLLDEVEHFAHLPEDLDLVGPFDIAWQTGTMSAELDLLTNRVEIEIRSFDIADDTEYVATFGATKEQVGAWAIRGRLLVEAGRPPCPLCGYPLDPAGHACPRSNGNRPPSL